MPYDIKNRLKIAVTSRALFQLEHENEIYEKEGLEAYEKYQVEHENEILKPGAGFQLIKALLRLNETPGMEESVEVLIASRNSANTSNRVFNSIEHYGLDITRGMFSAGADIAKYLPVYDIDLFLTAKPKDAQAAIDAKIPAATIVTEHAKDYDTESEIDEIKIAFDGDAVLFSDESEAIYKQYGLDAFAEYEKKRAEQPMEEGPFAKFLRAVNKVQNNQDNSPVKIRTALVTSRNAPAHKRVITTLRAWNVRIDETFFLGGLPKTDILKAFGAHIFFDDQKVYSESAAAVVPSATVPYLSTSTLFAE